mmetsp:Transcript_34302/g.81274  ORF Transcript_34302/g.81274 Transcript_34302/m.81274 type:complete len:258 (+) Transcript_34302:220-993(+)
MGLEAGEKVGEASDNHRFENLLGKVGEKFCEDVDNRRVEVCRPVLVENLAAFEGHVDDVHLAHRDQRDQQEKHRDSHPGVLLLPEDRADHDALHRCLDNALAHEGGIHPQHLEMPPDVEREQLHERRAKLGREGRLVHRVLAPVAAVGDGLGEARLDERVEHLRALPPLRHLDARRGHGDRLEAGHEVDRGILRADVHQEIGEVDVLRTLEAKLLKVARTRRHRPMIHQVAARTQEEKIVEEGYYVRRRLQEGYDAC